MTTQTQLIDQREINADELAEKQERVTNKISTTEEYREKVGTVNPAYIIDFDEAKNSIQFDLALPDGRVGHIRLSLQEKSLEETPAEQFLKSIGGSTNPSDLMFEDVPAVFTKDEQWRIIYGEENEVYYEVGDEDEGSLLIPERKSINTSGYLEISDKYKMLLKKLVGVLLTVIALPVIVLTFFQPEPGASLASLPIAFFTGIAFLFIVDVIENSSVDLEYSTTVPSSTTEPSEYFDEETEVNKTLIQY